MGWSRWSGCTSPSTDTGGARGDDGYLVPLRRADDPDRWRALCDDPDEAIVTQVDGGAEDRGFWPTSSSSAPTVMLRMLEALDVRPGMRVLEIGAGTGYNAALLAEAGATVTTVEIGPGLADQARAALDRAGYRVSVVTGDGIAGHEPDAPYDRVIATAAATQVPRAWVAQARPGGRIVLPWTSAFCPTGALLILTVDEDGAAAGRFDGPAAFMPLRGIQSGGGTRTGDDDGDDETESTTGLYPRELFEDDFDLAFAIGVMLPGCSHGHRRNDDRTRTLNLSHPDSGSWASLTTGDPRHEVYQKGRRRLWDEFAAAYQWWLDAGKPEHTRFGLTVTPDHHTIWLDSPESSVR